MPQKTDTKFIQFFKKYKIPILIISPILFLALLAFILFSISRNDNSPEQDTYIPPIVEEPQQEDSDAVKAGKQLSNNFCTGTGPVTLSHSPMDPEDFLILIPYGLVVGGHVTPIDHQYFAPKDPRSKRDTYEVYALADGVITDISKRDRVNPDNPNDKFEEYRMVFSHTCTFLTYFDLVTSLVPEIKEKYDSTKNERGYTGSINFPVKAGQLIGRIGGQTLDFAVWDTEKPLTGFITTALYSEESWKLYTANPYDYMTEELKTLLIQRNPRTVEPIEGKIDYDQAGKLVGNWFELGTNGYTGSKGEGGGSYWAGHLSIAPDHYDPSVYRLSFGSIGGDARQFISKDISFDASAITATSGIVKVNLAQGIYTDQSGRSWNGNTLIKGPKLKASSGSIYGCVLFELQEGEKLKMEAFVGKTCSNVTGFSAGVKTYER